MSVDAAVEVGPAIAVAVSPVASAKVALLAVRSAVPLARAQHGGHRGGMGCGHRAVAQEGFFHSSQVFEVAPSVVRAVSPVASAQWAYGALRAPASAAVPVGQGWRCGDVGLVLGLESVVPALVLDSVVLGLEARVEARRGTVVLGLESAVPALVLDSVVLGLEARVEPGRGTVVLVEKGSVDLLGGNLLGVRSA